MQRNAGRYRKALVKATDATEVTGAKVKSPASHGETHMGRAKTSVMSPLSSGYVNPVCVGGKQDSQDSHVRMETSAMNPP